MFEGPGMPVMGMMDEAAFPGLWSFMQEIGKGFAQVRGIDMHLGAAGGQQFRFPGGGVRSTGNNSAFS
ncbi:hypothetical protein D3C87_2133530 [compost metagenome]